MQDTYTVVVQVNIVALRSFLVFFLLADFLQADAVLGIGMIDGDD